MPELVTLDHITNAEQLDLGKESQRIDRNKNILEKSHASTQEGNQTAEWILEVITSLTSTPPHLSKVLEKIVGLRINLGWSPTQIQDLEKVIVDYVNRTSDNQNLLDKLSGELKSCQEAAAKRVQEARDGKSSEEQLSQQLQEAQNARRVVEKEKNDALGTVHDYKNRITKMQKDYINFLSWTGFDYKSKRPGGWTALHGAALVDSRELVELFVGLGADVDARTDKVDSTYGTYQTPLHIAAKNGEPGIAAGALIDARALVEARDGGGMTPLITAITYGRISTIRHLVARGAGVSTPNDNGETPLSKAIEINSEEIVRYLLDRGANIEAGRSGYTPLMLAIVYQRKEMVVALVEHGAYVNAKSTVGSPLSLALQGNDKSIVDFLRSRGAR
ncbi:ankyrin repeat-containing domain protein [Xylaria sp. FL1777]|nr:ankyrin repeat-containing domain protein [Xylaria sp. FL1777]